MAIASKNRENFNEINITPLTDIFLVLLIIMMVVAPMFQNVDQNIEVPEINSGLSVEENELIVSVTKDGGFYVNKAPVSKESLAQELSSAKEQTGEKNLILRADKLAKNKDVLAVIQAAQSAGLEKLTIAGEPLTKSQESELKKPAPMEPIQPINVPTED
ncbi:MAG: ExbD/TolR family protein [Vampirovibrionia bacterium]